MGNAKLLDVSWGTILKIGIAALGFYFLYLVRDILALVLFALVISILFNPAIDFVQRFRISRLVATSFVYVLIFGFLGISVYLISLVFIDEIRQISGSFSQYFALISPPLTGLGFEAFESLDLFLSSVDRWLRGASQSIFASLAVFFGGVFASFFIFFLAFFFSLEEKSVQEWLLAVSPKRYESLAQNIWTKSQQKISGWFGAKLLASFFVGLAFFAALKVFKVDYAISLSLLAAISNLIPLVGPFFAGAVITLLVVFDDWLKALFILGIFVLIQQIENNILGPILTKRFVGLPASLVLISLVLGGKLFGILGVILAIPLTAVLFDFLKEFLEKKKVKETAPPSY